MKKIVESYKHRLASEEGWVLKRGAQLRLALCYPNTYAIGMANLGFQAMYEIFNNIAEVSCERVFLPDDVRSPSVGEGSSANKAAGHQRNSKHPRNGSGYDALPGDQLTRAARAGTPGGRASNTNE